MIILKSCLYNCGYSIIQFTKKYNISKSHFNLVLTGKKELTEQMRARVINAIKSDKTMNAWLKKKKYSFQDIWNDIDTEPEIACPKGHNKKLAKIRNQFLENQKNLIGNPTIYKKEKKHMSAFLTQKTLQNFNLFENPFENDIKDIKDIYFSKEHNFLKQMLIDAACNEKFMAIVGEVGSGKSLIRMAVSDKLESMGVKIIYPEIRPFYYSRKSNSMCGAFISSIVLALSIERPKPSIEDRMNQAISILKNRKRNGQNQCLIIEEAHTLDSKAFYALKDLFDKKDNFNRLLSIILIGQPELSSILDETHNNEIRHAIRRITIAEITGLGKDIGPYLNHKLRKYNTNIDNIFEKEAIEAIDKRLRIKNGRKTILTSYPLSVNNLSIKAMNMATEFGFKKVNAESVYQA